jgi:hypothetical protein
MKGEIRTYTKKQNKEYISISQKESKKIAPL